MKFRALLCFAFFLLAASTVPAAEISIAAASDLKFCMDEIIVAFKSGHADAVVNVTFGSSGNFAAQIREGAPFDVFFSADSEYPRALAKDGFAASPPVPYAVGRIVLWSATVDASKMTLADLARPEIAKIAIANPQHAPYGKRAEQALRASGLWDKVQPKLVLGENIAQTAQFVQSGNAQAGIIALSLALNPELAGKGGYYLIPDTLHEPLQQAFVITRRAADNELAKAFADYMQGDDARKLMLHHGFTLPGEAPH
jgi:molybdate transport system substrate-binding protein